MHLTTTAILVSAATAAACAGTTAPFTETFDTGANNWLGGDFLPPTEFATGGIDDSGYIQTQAGFQFAEADGFNIVFRGNTGLFPGTDASDGSFNGDWISSGITNVSFSVRHDITQPVTFFIRIAANSNGAPFPGGVAIAFQPVLAGEWTDISFDISPNNPAFVSFENSTFETVFSNVGFVQIGIATPVGLVGDPSLFSVDLDNVAIIPAPAGLAVFAAGLLASRRRRG